VFGSDHLRRIAIPDLDLISVSAGNKATAAVHRGDLVLAEQQADAAGEGIDDLVFARQHGGDVDRHILYGDAVFAELVQRALVILRGLKQRLGGDAADVQAGAPEAGLALGVLPLVDADGVESELRRADRRSVAAGAGANHRDVKGLCHVFSLKA
jgi:hypothetical protein